MISVRFFSLSINELCRACNKLSLKYQYHRLIWISKIVPPLETAKNIFSCCFFLLLILVFYGQVKFEFMSN